MTVEFSAASQLMCGVGGINRHRHKGFFQKLNNSVANFRFLFVAVEGSNVDK
jgi:hypothetical protein